MVLNGRSTTAGPLPTDELGHFIYPVVYPNGELLPTVESGVFVNPENGAEIERDEQGVPLDDQGRPLPRNEFRQYVYGAKPAEGTGDEKIRPTMVWSRAPDDTLEQTKMEGNRVDDQLAGSMDGRLETTQVGFGIWGKIGTLFRNLQPRRDRRLW